MRASTILFAVAAVTPAFALPQYAAQLVTRQTNGSLSVGVWAKPGSDDARGPCPGLNTLANHGFLPRNGKEITLDILTKAMKDGYNINPLDARILFPQAARTNPNYPRERDSFDLDTLGREGVLEHDISLSRSDRFFADPLPFNETVWAETMSYFPDDMITVQQLADARMGRLETSKKTNPEHELTALGDGFSWGECASFFGIMADGTTGTVEKRFIDYWMRNERMPTEIGWERRTMEMQTSERTKFTNQLMEAAGVGRGLGGFSGLGGRGGSLG